MAKVSLEQIKNYFDLYFSIQGPLGKEPIGTFAYLDTHDPARDLDLFEVHFMLDDSHNTYFITQESDIEKAHMRFFELAMKKMQRQAALKIIAQE